MFPFSDLQPTTLVGLVRVDFGTFQNRAAIEDRNRSIVIARFDGVPNFSGQYPLLPAYVAVGKCDQPVRA